MKFVIVSILLLACISARAEEEVTPEAEITDVAPTTDAAQGAETSTAAEVSTGSLEQQLRNWAVELHINAVSNSITPTFGPSVLWSLNPANSVGIRFLAPFSTHAAGTSSVMGFYRYNIGAEKMTYFGELSVGQNYYRTESSDWQYADTSGSAGTNLGVIYHYNPEIAFGGIAGGEWTRTNIDKDTVTERSDTRIYGRLGVFGSLLF